jgi:hypothetical protein
MKSLVGLRYTSLWSIAWARFAGRVLRATHRMNVPTFLACTWVFWVALGNGGAAAQNPDRYQELSSAFEQQLSKLTDWCQSEGLSEEASRTDILRLKRDPARAYFFLPPAQAIWESGAAQGLAESWRQKFAAICREHAASLFALAQEQAQAGSESTGYALLHEVCTVDPDHADARRILGYQLRDGRWLESSTVVKQQAPRVPHRLMGWQPRDYLIVESVNYHIASTATPEQTLALTEDLERWRVVWRQAFFDYWCPKGRLTEWIEGKSRPSARPRHEVVFFGSRDQYVRDLSRLGVAGVEHSTGFYSDRHETMFFYQSDPIPSETWRQEQAHQLFQEAGSSSRDPVARSHVWALEGIAMYFESLVDFPMWATLGGFDHGRLQFARIHWQREKFFVPFDDLTNLGREAFQTHPQVAKLYSQSAGMTHFLMSDGGGRYRSAMLQLIEAVYQRKAKTDTLAVLCGKSTAELEEEYREFLTVDRDQVVQFLFDGPRRTELALGYSNVDGSIAAALRECVNLRWLQLSRTHVDDSIGPALESMSHLKQLFLDQTDVTDQILPALLNLDRLEELDLADTKITDAGMAIIARMTQLKALWLTGTSVTDEGLAQLEALSNLQLLDVRRTNVTAEGESRLRRRLPQLK